METNESNPHRYGDIMTTGESGYERIKGNRYFTEPWVTCALLKRFKFSPSIWEPAAGMGHMSAVIAMYGYNVLSTDIEPIEANQIYYGDFFHATSCMNRDIITNPAYDDRTEEFINHALALTERDGNRVALLLRNEYDSASTREYLFDDHPAWSFKFTLTRRPRWVVETGSPRHNYAWFIWDWENPAGGLNIHGQ
jgi:hypothetical protein